MCVKNRTHLLNKPISESHLHTTRSKSQKAKNWTVLKDIITCSTLKNVVYICIFRLLTRRGNLCRRTCLIYCEPLRARTARPLSKSRRPIASDHATPLRNIQLLNVDDFLDDVVSCLHFPLIVQQRLSVQSDGDSVTAILLISHTPVRSATNASSDIRRFHVRNRISVQLHCTTKQHVQKTEAESVAGGQG